MPFWKAGKNDDQVLDELKETQKQNADEFVKKQEHADEAQKSSLIIDNNFTPVEYDPQYILQVNHLKKYFPIKGGMVSKTVGYVKAVDGVTFNLKRGTTMGLVGESGCGKTTTGRTIRRRRRVRLRQIGHEFVAHAAFAAPAGSGRGGRNSPEPRQQGLRRDEGA